MLSAIALISNMISFIATFDKQGLIFFLSNFRIIKQIHTFHKHILIILKSNNNKWKLILLSEYYIQYLILILLLLCTIKLFHFQ